MSEKEKAIAELAQTAADDLLLNRVAHLSADGKSVTWHNKEVEDRLLLLAKCSHDLGFAAGREAERAAAKEQMLLKPGELERVAAGEEKGERDGA